jgi:hypothetical protein
MIHNCKCRFFLVLHVLICMNENIYCSVHGMLIYAQIKLKLSLILNRRKQGYLEFKEERGGTLHTSKMKLQFFYVKATHTV